jgi:hypothetical protein
MTIEIRGMKIELTENEVQGLKRQLYESNWDSVAKRTAQAPYANGTTSDNTLQYLQNLGYTVV